MCSGTLLSMQHTTNWSPLRAHVTTGEISRVLLQMMVLLQMQAGV